VRIVAPFPAGGSADVIPRIIGEKLSLKWGQPVIVENRAGAAGNIGAEYVFKAEPDGYTLLSSRRRLSSSIRTCTGTFLRPDSVRAGRHHGRDPNVVLVNPKVPVNNIRELIAYAKANPDKLNYARRAAARLAPHRRDVQIDWRRAPHAHPLQGQRAALTDLLAGSGDDVRQSRRVRQHVTSGKLKLLAVCSEKRVASLPDVPALAEILPDSRRPRGSASSRHRRLRCRSPRNLRRRRRGAEAARGAEAPCRSLRRVDRQHAGADGGIHEKDSERWRAVIRSAGVKAD